MENATKALMIAAAVLVVMLIIGLGIGVFNMASEQVDNAGDLSEYQIQQFNDKFYRYRGENVSGTDVNALLTTVYTHNNAQESNDTCVSVSYPAGSAFKSAKITATNNATNPPAEVVTGARFTVTMTVNTKTDLVNAITITKVK